MDPQTLGALAGFSGALVTLGIPVGKVLYDTRQDASKAVRLLSGEEEVEGDGVIPRLRSVEQRSAENRLALRRCDCAEVPDLEPEREVPVTDGGPEVEEEEIEIEVIR